MCLLIGIFLFMLWLVANMAGAGCAEAFAVTMVTLALIVISSNW